MAVSKNNKNIPPESQSEANLRKASWFIMIIGAGLVSWAIISENSHTKLRNDILYYRQEVAEGRLHVDDGTRIMMSRELGPAKNYMGELAVGYVLLFAGLYCSVRANKMKKQREGA